MREVKNFIFGHENLVTSKSIIFAEEIFIVILLGIVKHSLLIVSSMWFLALLIPVLMMTSTVVSSTTCDYSCDAGDTLSITSCSHLYTGTTSTTCAAGWTLSSGSCVKDMCPAAGIWAFVRGNLPSNPTQIACFQGAPSPAFFFSGSYTCLPALGGPGGDMWYEFISGTGAMCYTFAGFGVSCGGTWLSNDGECRDNSQRIVTSSCDAGDTTVSGSTCKHLYSAFLTTTSTKCALAGSTCSWCALGYCANLCIAQCRLAGSAILCPSRVCSWCSGLTYCAPKSSCASQCYQLSQADCSVASPCGWCSELQYCQPSAEICNSACFQLSQTYCSVSLACGAWCPLNYCASSSASCATACLAVDATTCQTAPAISISCQFCAMGYCDAKTTSCSTQCIGSSPMICSYVASYSGKCSRCSSLDYCVPSSDHSPIQPAPLSAQRSFIGRISASLRRRATGARTTTAAASLY